MNVNYSPAQVSIQIPSAKASVTVNPATVSISVNPATVILQAPNAQARIMAGTPIVREYINAQPYDGEYTVTPLAETAVVLPTKDKILNDDVTVKKVPYFETANPSGGKTAYIAMEV